MAFLTNSSLVTFKKENYHLHSNEAQPDIQFVVIPQMIA